MDKEYLRNFERKVKNTIRKYKLLNKKERVIAALSGGKDSTSVAHILNKLGYSVEALTIDLGIGEWSERHLENIKKFCKDEGIKLYIVSMKKELGASVCYIRSAIQQKERLTNCMICGVIKKWILNKKAKQLKAQKIATGHNIDDEAETALMNLLKGNLRFEASAGPVSGIVKDKKFVQRVKPLFFLTNKEIEKYSKEMGFPVLCGACPCLTNSFRKRVRGGIKELEKEIPNLKRKLIENILKIAPELQKKQATGKVESCEICGEASRGKICKRCQLIRILKK